jgi:hypothetical protein
LGSPVFLQRLLIHFRDRSLRAPSFLCSLVIIFYLILGARWGVGSQVEVLPYFLLVLIPPPLVFFSSSHAAALFLVSSLIARRIAICALALLF